MKIVVSRDSEMLQEIDLSEEASRSVGDSLSFFIGRSDECHVVLDDPQVSREHAQLDYQNGLWTIRQLSEFGKININGSVVSDKQLSAGDMAIIGPFVLSFFPQVLQASTPTSSVASMDNGEEDLEKNEPDDAATKTQMNEEQLMDEGAALEDETQFLESESDEESQDHGEGLEDLDTFESEHPPADEDSGFISGGAQSVEFSAENNDTAFPEENEIDDINSFEETQSEFNDGALDILDDDDGGFDDESTKVLQTFAKFQLDIFGEFAPYDKYNLESAETTIGRDPAKCQIVLNDPEVSSVHATIRKNNITCTIEDMQSGNGTLLNGERINKSALTNGDEFIIGSTTFTVKIVSDFLDQEKERLMPVEENQVVEIEEIVEVDADFDDGDIEEGGVSFGEAQAPAGKQSLVQKFRSLPPKKQLIYGIIGIALILLLLEDDGTSSKAPESSATTAQQTEEPKPEETEVVLSPEVLEIVEASYQLANTYIQRGMYDEALQELDNNIFRYTPKYKNADQLKELALAGIQERERIEERRQKEIREAERREKVKDLVERAKVAVKERNVMVAEELFAQIAIIDPDNFDVSALKIELDAWKKEEERKAVLAAQKEAERKRMIDLLKPGKEAFLRKEWYNSTIRLQQFLDNDNMDEDLIEEAARMLTKAQEELDTIVGPLMGRARSLREGQDLKGAYELYGQILSHHPANGEAMDEMREIREILTLRSRKVYREAIIAESLSLLQDAKEKFQEVQQISPTDSEYYIKATNKLKDYIE